MRKHLKTFEMKTLLNRRDVENCGRRTLTQNISFKNLGSIVVLGIIARLWTIRYMCWGTQSKLKEGFVARRRYLEHVDNTTKNDEPVGKSVKIIQQMSIPIFVLS